MMTRTLALLRVSWHMLSRRNWLQLLIFGTLHVRELGAVASINEPNRVIDALFVALLMPILFSDDGLGASGKNARRVVFLPVEPYKVAAAISVWLCGGLLLVTLAVWRLGAWGNLHALLRVPSHLAHAPVVARVIYLSSSLVFVMPAFLASCLAGARSARPSAFEISPHLLSLTLSLALLDWLFGGAPIARAVLGGAALIVVVAPRCFGALTSAKQGRCMTPMSGVACCFCLFPHLAIATGSAFAGALNASSCTRFALFDCLYWHAYGRRGSTRHWWALGYDWDHWHHGYAWQNHRATRD